MATKIIPSNYNAMEGKFRNIVETVIIDGLYLFIIFMTGVSIKTGIYLSLGLIPVSVFGIMGIEGQSLIQSLFNYIRFIKRKRILSQPSQEYIREKNKAIMLKKQKEAHRRKERQK